MIAEVLLLGDCPPPVAVGAPHLTLPDLSLQIRDRGFAICQLDHAGPLRADVVELEHHGVALAAVDARGSSQMLKEEQEISPAQWSGAPGRPPFRIDPP
jgi:hypothetical protein